MTCPNCGKEVNDGVSFCGECGTTFKEAEKVDTVVTQVQEPVVETPVVNQVNNDSKLKGIKGNKLLLIIPIAVAVLLAIIALVFIVPKIFKSDSVEDPTYSTSFFLKNSDGKYALFNKDGKRLTDFIFKKADSFYNGYAMVVNDKDQYGIIKPNGKLSVGFGKYPLMFEYNGLYVVPSSNSEYKFNLISPSGKTIAKMKTNDVSTLTYSVDSIVYVETDKTYDVYNYKGKKIKSFKKINNDSSPKTNADSGYGTIYYNGETVVFNEVTGDYVATIREKDTHYCVNNASKDGKILTFNSCVGTFEKQDKVTYKVLVNKKEVKVDSACTKTYLTSDVLVCDTEKDRYILNSKYKLGTKISTYSSAIIDRDTFATKEDDGFSFYKKGKMVKHITDVSSVSTGGAKEFYVVKDSKDYLYYFYDKDGNKAIKTGYKIANSFDENGLAVVGNDYYSYYLIDKKGNKVGDTYYNISRVGETDKYKVSTKDTSNRKYGIINSKGKTVLDLKYYSIDTKVVREDIYLINRLSSDGDYELMNIKNFKKIGTYSERPTLMAQYFYTTKNDKTEYYTYKGKKFHER